MPDVAEGKVPVLASIRAAWRFSLANWTRFLPAAVLVGLAAGLSALLPDSNQASAAGFAPLAGSLANLALTVTSGAVFSAAVLRVAVRNDYPTPLGMAFGADELRLIAIVAALGAMFAPFLILILVVLFIVVLGKSASSPDELARLLADPKAFSEAAAQHLGAGGALAFLVLVAGVCAAMIFVSVRLTLVNAATIGERRIVIFQTWSWTHGNLLRVLAAVVLTAFPAVFIAYFVSAIVDAALSADHASGAVLAVDATLQGFVSALSQIPSLALVAHLYQGLRPPQFQAK